MRNFLVVVVASGCAAAMSIPPALAQDRKVLHAGISDTGIFSEELQARLGLGVARVKGRLVVALLMPGRAMSAGLRERDTILQSQLTDDALSMTIERDGQRFPLNISLTDKATSPPPARPKPIAGSGVSTLREGLVEPITDSKIWPGARIFNAECAAQDPRTGQWAQSIRNIEHTGEKLWAYVRWPNKLFGYRKYHLVAASDGQIISYQLLQSKTDLPENKDLFDSYAKAYLSALSATKIFALPPGSRLEHFECNFIIHTTELHLPQSN